MALKYSATSVFIPHLDLEQTCKLLGDAGYDGIELRVRPYTGDPDAEPTAWGRHITNVSPDNIASRADEIRQAAAANGLQIAALATNCRANELDEVKKVAKGAAALGCKTVRVGAPRGYDGSVPYRELYDEAVRAYEQALPITRANGVRAVLETHGGTIFVSSSLAYRIVSNFDAADIGVIYDPQNMVSDGYETTPLALDLLGDYVAHAHVGGHKPLATEPDEHGTVRYSYPSCRMGEGAYDYPRLIKELVRRNYQGFISVEDFDTSRSSEDRAREAIDYLRRIEAAG